MAQPLAEGGIRYLHIPSLRLPSGCSPGFLEALLCLDARDGYPTRLFFSEAVTTQGKSLNWNGRANILGKNWVGFSWNNVPNNQPPLQILLAHLDALR